MLPSPHIWPEETAASLHVSEKAADGRCAGYLYGLARDHRAQRFFQIAPLAGSPAIDAGTQMGLPLDQIGQIRPVLVSGAVNGGDGSDIGAFEVQCSATSGSPFLDIRLTGASLIVSWPAPSFCYVFQQSPDLMNWVNSAFPVNVAGTQNQVIINPAPQGPIFFRLIHL